MHYFIYFDTPEHSEAFSVYRQGSERMLVAVANSIDEARKHIPEGLQCSGRYIEDNPKICEVWF